MPDQSELDTRYFLDPHRYNCPYCNRGSVAYTIEDVEDFDWSDTKKAYIYFVRCASCGKKSMHLTYRGDLSMLVGTGYGRASLLPCDRRRAHRPPDTHQAGQGLARLDCPGHLVTSLPLPPGRTPRLIGPLYI